MTTKTEARALATASFPELMQRAGLTTAPCEDCGAGADTDCDVDCPSQFARDKAELGQASLRTIILATLIGVAIVLAIILAALFGGPEKHHKHDNPSDCAQAVTYADALRTQHNLVLDYVRQVNTAHKVGDHDAAVQASIAGQRALDAYRWTETAYTNAAAQCGAVS